MESIAASALLATLGHPGRLDVFRLIARRAPGGVRPGEMAEALGLKPNTLSVYLSALEQAGLIEARRQGRAIYYRLQTAPMGALIDFLVLDCCRSRPELCAPRTAYALSPTDKGPADMADMSFNVLFICTGNSARSIFAEALLRDLGGEKFNAYSAGVQPYSALNPNAVELLQRNGHDIAPLRSKQISEYQTEGAPEMDFVFTVCDTAANEECPPWPGQPISGHWGLPDPVKAAGTEAEKSLAFARSYAAMRRRIQAFVALPFSQLDRLSLQQRVDEIAEIDASADA